MDENRIKKYQNLDITDYEKTEKKKDGPYLLRDE